MVWDRNKLFPHHTFKGYIYHPKRLDFHCNVIALHKLHGEWQRGGRAWHIKGAVWCSIQIEKVDASKDGSCINLFGMAGTTPGCTSMFSHWSTQHKGWGTGRLMVSAPFWVDQLPYNVVPTTSLWFCVDEMRSIGEGVNKGHSMAFWVRMVHKILATPLDLKLEVGFMCSTGSEACGWLYVCSGGKSRSTRDRLVGGWVCNSQNSHSGLRWGTYVWWSATMSVALLRKKLSA